LSDKLLKSSATRHEAHRCEVAYNTLSSFRVKRLFSLFSGGVPEGSLLTRGLEAVVPCQWERIIGSYSEPATPNLR